MTFDQFIKHLQSIKPNALQDIVLKLESAALRFVDDNFRNQGWEGQAWQESTGTILVKSGDLRRDFSSEVSPGQVKITNRLPYAIIHNKGFDGEVSIPQHNRAIYVKSGRNTKRTGMITVKAHKRHMRVPKRQFAPYDGSPSPTLNRIVKNIVLTEFTKLLKP